MHLHLSKLSKLILFEAAAVNHRADTNPLKDEV